MVCILNKNNYRSIKLLLKKRHLYTLGQANVNCESYAIVHSPVRWMREMSTHLAGQIHLWQVYVLLGNRMRLSLAWVQYCTIYSSIALRAICCCYPRVYHTLKRGGGWKLCFMKLQIFTLKKEKSRMCFYFHLQCIKQTMYK